MSSPSDATFEAPKRVGFFGRVTQRRRLRRVRASSSVSSHSAAPLLGCCFFGFHRAQVKAVRFSSRIAQDPSLADSRTPRVVRGTRGRGIKVDTDKGLLRSVSRKTFHTAVSSARRSNSRSSLDSTSASPPNTTGDEKEEEEEDVMPCLCAFPQHLTYTPETPIITAPGVFPGSYEELLAQAKSMLGSWITILERSQSLDEHMTYIGVNRMKRMIMNKIAIPFTAVLEDKDTLLHAWITTPVGQKHTQASLIGRETLDQDGDLGDWTAKTSVVDYSVSWFCGGKPVRAMQMERKNPKFGLCFETRVVLPDATEGKILLYNFTVHPPEYSGKGMLTVDRLFRVAN
eukprot:Blabericola_migrator_1__7317@NODE_3720_length_1556_cov_671_147750_g2309_i0_p1_GENE_NODE_3720_length_1556_cov_671_147750_g2309_i0NODE_3720_length_1556_cov_671_147750_g2309_i0_p1_ORF_typecomplete_len344_score33_31_NODE_3720_length_1556_cov_671_147750_g2309_i0801111